MGIRYKKVLKVKNFKVAKIYYECRAKNHNKGGGVQRSPHAS